MNIIDLYISNLRREDVLLFAIRNKDSFDLSKYKDEFSQENYLKIEKLLKQYINYL